MLLERLVDLVHLRGEVERLADREEADGDRHHLDAVEQLRDAEGEARLAGLVVDADQPDRRARGRGSPGRAASIRPAPRTRW